MQDMKNNQTVLFGEIHGQIMTNHIPFPCPSCEVEQKIATFSLVPKGHGIHTWLGRRSVSSRCVSPKPASNLSQKCAVTTCNDAVFVLGHTILRVFIFQYSLASYFALCTQRGWCLTFTPDSQRTKQLYHRCSLSFQAWSTGFTPTLVGRVQGRADRSRKLIFPAKVYAGLRYIPHNLSLFLTTSLGCGFTRACTSFGGFCLFFGRRFFLLLLFLR